MTGSDAGPTLLIDGNNVLMRAVKGMEHAGLVGDGAPTGAVMTFINSVARHVREEQPASVVVCWDGGRSEFRTALYARYKEDRERRREHGEHSPFAMAKEFLTLSGVLHTEVPGWEADDLIASYWRAVRAQDGRVVIVSGDHDLLQLVDPGTTQVKVGTGRAATERWDEARVLSALGCRPEHLAMAMALQGDPGDSVPGLRGVGPKRAAKMLQAGGWSWPEVLGGLEAAERALVELSLRLVDLRSVPGLLHAVPPPTRLTAPGDALYPHLVGFLRRYELRRIEESLARGTLWGDRAGSWL